MRNFCVCTFHSTMSIFWICLPFVASVGWSKGKAVPLQAWSGPEGSRKLTHCRRVTQKCVIALPCVVDGSCISTFFLHNRPFMTPTFRTIRHQQQDHSFRYSLFYPSVAIMALHRNVLQENDILCELYVDTRSDVSDYSDNESLDTDSDIPTTSSRKQL